MILVFTALSHAGTEELVGKKLIFVNCTHESLSGGHLELVDPDKVVLEIPPLGHAAAEEVATRLPILTGLRDHLRSQGHDYGDFPAHQGLWTMCEKTRHDILARMALVPRTLEARGLDATPQIQAKLRQVGTPDALAAVAILDTILRDEVGHVAIGNHWYRWLCDRAGHDPETHYATLVAQYEAPRLKPPFNETARKQAGFTDNELRWLQQL